MTKRFIPSIYGMDVGRKRKVVFGIPIAPGKRPYKQTIESLEASLPFVEAAGWEHGFTQTTGNPYISGARAEITRKAMDAKADAVFYIDYDMGWEPKDLVKVLTAEGDVVAGTYRCRTDDPDEELYMGALLNKPDDRPDVRELDGAIKAKVVPAGFLRVTTGAIDMFMRAYPNLCYGPQYSLSVDLFNHGAHEGLWWGEDYAFSRNYIDCGGEIWIVPDINLDHWQGERVYRGNYHEFLLRQDGGSKSASPNPPKEYAPRKLSAVIGGKGTSDKTFLWVKSSEMDYELTFDTHEEACFAKEKWLREFGSKEAVTA